MMYEWRKSLTGFPLKVTFDPVFKMDNLLMFVEISKTPTVGSLLEEIVRRCRLLKNVESEPLNTMLEVGNCKLLTSENVCALLDVEVVNIRYMPINTPRSESNLTNNCVTTSSSMSPSKKTAESLNKEHDIIPSLVKQNEESSFLSTNSLSKTSKRTKRKLTYDSIGYAIRELLAKQTESVDFIQPSVINKVVEYQEKKACDANNGTAEVGIDVVDDTSEIQLDTDEMSEEPNKKRRKRKRRRSKKQVENEIDANQGNSNFAPTIAQNPKRKHIYFTDCDDKESCNENGLTNYIPSEENSRRISEDNSSYSTFKSEKFVLDTQFKTVKPTSNYNIEKKYLYPDNSIRESANTVPEPIEETDASFVLSAGPRSNSTTPSQNIRFPSQVVDSVVLSNRSISHFLPFQKRERKDDVNIANDLATLLMPKELKTHCEYDVQFVDHKRNSIDSVKKVQSSINGNDAVSNSKLESKNIRVPSPVAYPWHNVELERQKIVEKLSSANPRTEALNNKQSGDFVDKNDLERETSQETTNDCQFLRQFKIEGNLIRMRKRNGVWLTLTPELAAAELPDVDFSKDNQSIIFQTMYVNKDYCPTVSGLIYANVLFYKPENEKLSLDIPPEFMKTLFDEYHENLPPTEEFTHIVGNTYEVRRHLLINVKLLV